MGEQEGTVQVGLDGAPPLGGVVVPYRTGGARYAGVVNKDGDGAQLALCARHELLDGAGVGDVGRHGYGGTAGAPYELDGLVELRNAASRHGDSCALACERNR